MSATLNFPPIAIVGQGLVLPGAHTPQDLWTALQNGRDLLSVSSDNPADRLKRAGEPVISSGRGGYVTNFDTLFDPTGFRMSVEEIQRSDVQLKWLLYAARQALNQAGYGVGPLPQVGLIVGNLGFPTRSLIQLSEYVWLSQQSPERLQEWDLERIVTKLRSTMSPELRFMSGHVIRQAARALGLGSLAYGLDAACASSLYAIEAACRALGHHRADVMVAGGINAADPLVLHKGFGLLQAMSPSGRSRPFDRDADGMVPAEGVAVVVLKRLEDAISHRDAVLGVIRAVGLSNDGADGGRLNPAQSGQIAAMAQAYRQAEWSLDDVSLIECHATGAPRGDEIEILSLSHVFRDVAEPVPIGSLKSNLGHLVTASGAAGLIKVLLAFAHQTRPQTLHVESPHPLLAKAPVRLVTENEPWRSATIRRAAVSSFGFGGTNAHLLVEEFQPEYHRDLSRQVMPKPTVDRPRVAVVALGIAQPRAGDEEAHLHIASAGLKLPPNDLKNCSGQQVLALQATRSALDAISDLPTNTGVYLGIESNPEVSRHVARIHAAEWAVSASVSIERDMLRTWQHDWAPPLDASGVMGVLPNMPANLINQLLDLTGPGETVLAGRASGSVSLALAMEALQDFCVDAAIAGAVDCGAEPVHQWAMTQRFPQVAGSPEDGALVLVLERLEDATRRGHTVLEVLTRSDYFNEAAEADPDALTWYATAGLRRLLKALPTLQRHVEAASADVDKGRSSAVRIGLHLPEVRLGALAHPVSEATAAAHPLGQVMAMPPFDRPAISSAILDSFHHAEPMASVGPAESLFVSVAQAHQQFLRTAQQQHQQFLQTMALLSGAAPVRSVEGNGLGGQSRLQHEQAVIESRPAPASVVRSWDRSQLLVHANGRLSEIFGPQFSSLDDYAIRARMPAPPLLLVDRVRDLTGEPGGLGQGRVVTETFVAPDHWYVHDGYMAAGAMVESGQADLFLISWLGIDFVTRGQRRYRLLGCELTFHGPLARPGDLMRFEIEVDRYVAYGDVHLFFFHNDGYIDQERRISVRNGQAGFFTEEELANASGVLFEPETMAPEPGLLDAPAVCVNDTGLTHDQLLALAQGRPWDCFGAAFDRAKTHVRTPRIAAPPLLMLDEVVTIDARGGPWQRGYLCAKTTVHGDEWFFDGHFHNDPAMPGTLMFEGTVQALTVYLLSTGFSLDKDGWRFQPQCGRPYKMVCRGQVTPASQELTYEVFVRELCAGPKPRVVADVLVTVDGLKAFYCEALALELVPDWPITSVVKEGGQDNPVLQAAIGRLSHVFGERYAEFDEIRHAPRLPGPPFMFVSRILQSHVEDGLVGSWVQTEFTLDAHAWYCDTPGAEVDVAVLSEIALQPCGWLATLAGIPLESPEDVAIRNLDGSLTMTGTLSKSGGPVQVRAELERVDRVGGMIIERYAVEIDQAGERVATLSTVFGHFTQAALKSQVGIARDAAILARASAVREQLKAPNADDWDMPTLEILDDVTGFWPKMGRAQLGVVRTHKRIDARDWFFRAHFYQDPVQPGSLGLQAVYQTLQWYITRQLGVAGTTHLAKTPLTWKYRGQILPHHQAMTVEVEIRAIDQADSRVEVVADAWIWADDVAIYEISHIGIVAERVASDGVERGFRLALEWDPQEHAWIADHRPTLTRPALPLAYVADLLARHVLEAAPGRGSLQIDNLSMKRWIAADRPLRLQIETEPLSGMPKTFLARLLSWRDADDRRLSRFDVAASGRICLAPSDAPSRSWQEWPALQNPRPLTDPYASKVLVHGPSLQVIRQVTIADNGAEAELEPSVEEELRGVLGVALLDGLAQMIGAMYLAQAPESPVAAFPVEIVHGLFRSRPPHQGPVLARIRRLGEVEIAVANAVHAYDSVLLVGGELWAQLRWKVRLFPTGRWGTLDPRERYDFLTQRRYVAHALLSRVEGNEVVLESDEVNSVNWYPGTVQDVYALGDTGQADLVEIAVKEWAAQISGQHPARIRLDLKNQCAIAPTDPLHPWPFKVRRQPHFVAVQRDRSRDSLSLEPVREYVRLRSGQAGWLMEDIWIALAQQFVRRIVISDPEAWSRVSKSPVLYLANHQTGVESMLFALLMGSLTRVDVSAVAKAEHRQSWIGQWMARAASYPGASMPDSLQFVDRSRQEAVLHTVQQMEGLFKEGVSLLVHVAGTRSLSARQKTTTMSGLWIDLAIKAQIPVVPVRFVGGLPVQAVPERLEFPFQYAGQDYYLGPPIAPSEFLSMGYKDRMKRVIESMNALGVGSEEETPNPGDVAIVQEVKQWMQHYAVREPEAVMAVLLTRLANPGRDTEEFLRLGRSKMVKWAKNPRRLWLAEAARALLGEDAARIQWTGEEGQ